MTLVKFRPGLRNEMFNRQIQKHFDLFNDLAWNRTASYVPRVEIFEDEDKFSVNVEAPGMNKNDFKIKFEDHVLTIEGEKKAAEGREKKNIHLNERYYGGFKRAFTIPGEIDVNKISAEYKDGILSIELNKAEEEVKKEREIKIG